MGYLLIKSQKGVVAVEFALVTILILLPLMAGMVEFGMIFYDKAKITNASREGARLLITHGKSDGITSSDVEARVKNYCGDTDGIAKFLINPGDSNSTVTVSLSGFPDPDTNIKGDPFTVKVQYTYKYLFLSIMTKMLPLFPNGVTISAETTMSYMEPDE